METTEYMLGFCQVQWWNDDYINKITVKMMLQLQIHLLSDYMSNVMMAIKSLILPYCIQSLLESALQVCLSLALQTLNHLRMMINMAISIPITGFQSICASHGM